MNNCIALGHIAFPGQRERNHIPEAEVACVSCHQLHCATSLSSPSNWEDGVLQKNRWPLPRMGWYSLEKMKGWEIQFVERSPWEVPLPRHSMWRPPPWEFPSNTQHVEAVSLGSPSPTTPCRGCLPGNYPPPPYKASHPSDGGALLRSTPVPYTACRGRFSGKLLPHTHHVIFVPDILKPANSPGIRNSAFGN